MGSRPVAICTTIWVVILGAINLTLAIMGYLAYHCELDMNSNYVGMALNLVYFYNPQCSQTVDVPPIKIPIVSTDPVINEEIEVNVTVSINPAATERTYIWMITYMSLSSAWIFTSLILLVSSCFRSTGACLYLTLIPWVLTTLGNLGADITSTVYYMLDVFNTLSFGNLVDFLGVIITAGVIDLPDGIDIPEEEINQLIEEGIKEATEKLKSQNVPFTFAPSAFMVFFFSRGFLIGWIITFILMIVVIVEAVKKNKVEPKTNQHIIQPHATQPQYSYPNHHVMQNPPIINYGQNNPSAPVMTIDGLNNRQSDYITPNKVEPYSSSPPESSWLARRNNIEVIDKPSALKAGFEQRMNNPAPKINNEELRSQLPWSYTQDRSDQPRRSQLRPASLEEAPPVPVPDYTLHFPKRKREDADRANIRSITPPDAAPPAYKINDNKSSYF